MIADWDLDRFIAEDCPHSDLTTEALGLGQKYGQMDFITRHDMVIACAEEATRLLRRTGANVIHHPAPNGLVKSGTPILSAQGPLDSLMRGWKVAQTLIEMCSGMASAAHAIVQAARKANADCQIACTRKTFPGTRSLSIRAIQTGGAIPHRLGLSDSVLIFPEHWIFAPDIPLADLIARAARHCPERKVVMEVTSPETAILAARANADLIQLEKFTATQTANVVTTLRHSGYRGKIAAAGGISCQNAESYAAAGADILVTSAPYSAPPKDVAVSFSTMKMP